MPIVTGIDERVDFRPQLELMTYSAAIQFLYDLRWFGAKFGLSNTLKLAALAGIPQEKLRFIHVAGTNGKGSTCAMLESIYRAAGLRVGLFTSPHLVSFGERIQVNRQLIPKRDVVKLVHEMQRLLEQGWGRSPDRITGAGDHNGSPLDEIPQPPNEQHPTFFEVVTVMALRYFYAQKCDLVIWETGLGGRLDATNIVTPIASVITNIQYDHQNYLGETLASIAAEKAGIIKPNIPVITGANSAEALRVIQETARKQSAPFTVVQPSDAHNPPLDALALPLLGEHQNMNAAVALAAIRALAPVLPIERSAIHSGLTHLHWPGRLQLVNRPSGRRVLLDGAHNVGGAEMLAAALRQYFPGLKPSLVLGILRDKDWARMCEILAPLADRIVLVPVHSERSAEPHGLAEICRHANLNAQVLECPSLTEALEETVRDPFVTIAGSLYLVGEAMELLHLSPAKATDERGLNEWTNIASRSSSPVRADR
jgi:dihydrofolate synthase/folylpolyglutamate synthase